MKVFQHHIYEYRKGLRNLILHTISGHYRDRIENKLKKLGINYQIYSLSNGNINVFFGAKDCVDVIKAIGKESLTDYTPQEDFILGTMLGYDSLQQCRRYLGFISMDKCQLVDESLEIPDCDPTGEVVCGCQSSSKVRKECA